MAKPPPPLGTRFTSSHQGEPHTLTVIERDGKVRYELDDGRVFQSPWVAGQTITGHDISATFWKPSSTSQPAPLSPAAAKKGPSAEDVAIAVKKLEQHFEQQGPAIGKFLEEPLPPSESAIGRAAEIERAKVWARTESGGNARWHFAVMSLTSGRFDDVVQDIRDGRLTVQEATEIVRHLESRDLIAPVVGNDLVLKYKSLLPATEPFRGGARGEPAPEPKALAFTQAVQFTPATTAEIQAAIGSSPVAYSPPSVRILDTLPIRYMPSGDRYRGLEGSLTGQLLADADGTIYRVDRANGFSITADILDQNWERVGTAAFSVDPTDTHRFKDVRLAALRPSTTPQRSDDLTAIEVARLEKQKTSGGYQRVINEIRAERTAQQPARLETFSAGGVEQPADYTQSIGKNRDGDPIYVDHRGVRSYVHNGVRSTESVGLVSGQPSRYRNNDYKTMDELTDTEKSEYADYLASINVTSTPPVPVAEPERPLETFTAGGVEFVRQPLIQPTRVPERPLPYYVAMPQPDGSVKFIEPAEARPVTISGLDDSDLFLHRMVAVDGGPGDRWAISDAVTGRLLFADTTPEYVIDSAQRKIAASASGRAGIIKILADARSDARSGGARFPLSPRFGDLTQVDIRSTLESGIAEGGKPNGDETGERRVRRSYTRRPRSEGVSLPQGVQAQGIPSGEEGRRASGVDRPEGQELPGDGGKPDSDRDLGRRSLEPGDTPSDTGVGERLARAEPLPAPLAPASVSATIIAGATPLPNFLPAPSPAAKGRDLILPPGSDLGHAAGSAARFDANLTAIRTLKAVEESGRPATPEEQETIGRFSGWGDSAFEPAFKPDYDYEDSPYTRSYRTNIEPAWKRRHVDLKALTTPAEFEAIEKERRTAFFTTPTVINAMWKAVGDMGIDKLARPRIIEPAAGSGRFFGLQPPEWAARSQRTAVELDNLSGRMLKQTYPNVNTFIMGYQQAPLPNDSFDLAISNVPFSKVGVVDPAFRKGRSMMTRSIHNYFFAKSLDKVRPGGVIAFVTSHYTLDAAKSKPIREALAEQADFLGAVRLPKTAFPDTEVVTDVVFLRKRLPTDPPGDTTWVDTEPLKLMATRYGNRYEVEKDVNSYFVKHPEQVIGNHTTGGTQYSQDEYSVELPEGRDLAAEMTAALERLPKNVVTEAAPTEYRDAATPTAMNAHAGAFVIAEDGRLFRKTKDGALVASTLSSTDHGRVKDMLGIRDAAKTVLALNMKSAAADDLATGQEVLNALYDAFVQKHGPLNSNRNAGLMKEDPDGAFLLALERLTQLDPDQLKRLKAMTTGVGNAEQFKMPIFRQQVVRGLGRDSADNPADAMRVVLNRTGRLDFDRMGQLLGRDAATIQAALLQEGAIYKNPTGDWETADKYLSGNVRGKLTEAKAAASADHTYDVNVKSLEAVQPADIPANQINVRLGAPWVPEDDVNEFAKQLLGLYGSRFFSYVPQTGSWVKNARGQISGNYAKLGSEYGTSEMSGAVIFERMLNGQPITVTYTDENDKKIVDQKATIAAREKADAIETAFEQWLWMDSARADRLARFYNDTYNNIVPRTFDGSHLVLPGLKPDWYKRLHKHQRDAIWRITQDGTALLAHEVGFGKTAVMVAGGMELRRMGLSRKNMYVVPKATHGQFAEQFKDLYPYADVLYPGQADFTKEKRSEFLNRIITGDWDAVILSYEQFKSIPVKPETESAFIREQVLEYRAALEAEGEAGDKKSRTSKELQNALEALEVRLGKAQLAIKEHREDTVHWEDLGVDQLFVDEADSFKALPFATQLGRLKGIPNGKSQRAEDLFMKVRYQQQAGGGRGVVFATGTPVANTLAEAWTQMRYLQSSALEQRGLQHFDAWAKTFGQTTDGIEATVQGTYRPTQRFAKFANIPELSNLWQETADIRVIEEVPEMVKQRPRINNDDGSAERTVVAAQPDQALTEYMADIVARAEAMDPRHPEEDNMLKLSSDARKASLDMRLVDASAPENPDGKVPLAVANIARIYQETTPDKGTQLVFLDMGTPKVDDKKAEEGERDADNNDDTGTAASEQARQQSVYANIRTKLIEGGVPAAEIAFIHDAKTDNQRQMLFAKVNAGTIRILIGSTGKMGAGVNVQARAAALHHLDAPWRPRDIEQREGRIIRQGNKVYGPTLDAGEVVDPGRGVRIYQYVTVRSFDEFMWQAIEVKAKAIKAIMRRTPSMRTIEDIDPLVMSASEAKAIASGNPDVMKAVMLKNELNKLQLLQASHRDSLRKAQTEVRMLPERITAATDTARSLEKDAVFAATKEPFALTIRGKTLSKRPEAAEALVDAMQRVNAGHGEVSEPIGTYKGFNVHVKPGTAFLMNKAVATNTLILRHPETKLDYSTDAIWETNSPEGTLMRLENQIAAIPGALDNVRGRVAKYEAEYKSYQALANVPFNQRERLEAVAKELAEVETRLQGKSAEADAPVAPPPAVRQAAPAWQPPPPLPEYVAQRADTYYAPTPQPVPISVLRQIAGSDADYASAAERVKQQMLEEVSPEDEDEEGPDDGEDAATPTGPVTEWLAIGNTKPVHVQLRNLGGRWDSNRTAWVFRSRPSQEFPGVAYTPSYAPPPAYVPRGRRRRQFVGGYRGSTSPSASTFR